MVELVFRVAVEYPPEQIEHLLFIIAPAPEQDDAGVRGMTYRQKLGKVKIGSNDNTVLLAGGFDEVMIFGLVQADVGSVVRVMSILFQPRG